MKRHEIYLTYEGPENTPVCRMSHKLGVGDFVTYAAAIDLARRVAGIAYKLGQAAGTDSMLPMNADAIIDQAESE